MNKTDSGLERYDHVRAQFNHGDVIMYASSRASVKRQLMMMVFGWQRGFEYCAEVSACYPTCTAITDGEPQYRMSCYTTKG